MTQEALPLSCFTSTPPDLTFFLTSLKSFKVKKDKAFLQRGEASFYGSFGLNCRSVSPSLSSTDDETVSEKNQHVKV